MNRMETRRTRASDRDVPNRSETLEAVKPVIQLERTGCGIASAAAIARISYRAARERARALGIVARDPALWSDPRPVRRLLESFGIPTRRDEHPFRGWQRLPDLALLAIKWHLHEGRACWHWVVFVRDAREEYVLDSKPGLRCNVRIDFGRIRPKWYIEVANSRGASQPRSVRRRPALAGG